MQFIKNFSTITMADLPLVGGKNASIGEMINTLHKQNVTVPDGFAVTVDAYWYFLEQNNLVDKIKHLRQELHANNQSLEQTSKNIRSLIEQATLPKDLETAIQQAYEELCKQEKQCDVAVRSSATAEDLPTASFAGQQETFLNVQGVPALLTSYKKCVSSLFTPRAIIYRQEQDIDDMRVGLSVGVQKMVRSDLACSGVIFTLDTESGFKDVALINGSWGLGESIVQGIVTPDAFFVHKPTLQAGFKPILKKQLGAKTTKIIYTSNAENPITTVPVASDDQLKFCLTDNEILELANMALTIEKHYSEKAGKWVPMDIEWAKDGNDGKLYIVQARPETIYGAVNNHNVITHYNLKTPQKEREQLLITKGQSVGKKIASGKARVIDSAKHINEVQQGDIIVTTMTDPDWVPAMKKAAGIITNTGGRTCHAAIVSRELGIPAIIGTGNATTAIKHGEDVTLDCSQGETGFVYRGALPFEVTTTTIDTTTELPVKLMMNIGDPDQALALSFLPTDGVGLARLEFIIANAIKVHPMALLHPEQLSDKTIVEHINTITAPYPSNQDFFIDCIAEQAGTIAAAFYPRPVIIRLSDFKSNEYRNLIGGSFFEKEEENPMIGLRGASRYYSNTYQEAFKLECLAMKKMRDVMGLTNVKVMIPFVRTVEEAHIVIGLMKEYGLERSKNDLEIIMMCEIPSNVILIDQFSNYFDGFSIGSNDLTQMTLAIDRDSADLAALFDERNDAVIAMLTLAIEGAHRNKKPIGICGQGPSDHPELAQFLIELGIDSISLNPDSILPFIKAIS